MLKLLQFVCRTPRLNTNRKFSSSKTIVEWSQEKEITKIHEVTMRIEEKISRLDQKIDYFEKNLNEKISSLKYLGTVVGSIVSVGGGLLFTYSRLYPANQTCSQFN